MSLILNSNHHILICKQMYPSNIIVILVIVCPLYDSVISKIIMIHNRGGAFKHVIVGHVSFGDSCPNRYWDMTVPQQVGG